MLPALPHHTSCAPKNPKPSIVWYVTLLSSVSVTGSPKSVSSYVAVISASRDGIVSCAIFLEASSSKSASPVHPVNCFPSGSGFALTVMTCPAGYCPDPFPLLTVSLNFCGSLSSPPQLTAVASKPIIRKSVARILITIAFDVDPSSEDCPFLSPCAVLLL